jgi:trimethylamine--corrinoid protein Co-methyltransferase
MLNNYLEVVDNKSLDLLHDTSLRILEQIGMQVEDNDVLARLADEGCRLDLDTHRVYFQPDLVNKCLELVPRKVTLGARGNRKNLTIGEEGVRLVSRPLVGVENILDHRTNFVRQCTKQDLKEWVKLIDALDFIDFNGVLCPTDSHLPSRDVFSAAFGSRFTTKHLHVFAYSAQSVDFLSEIAGVLAGDRKSALKNPPISFFTVCISPLHLAKAGVGRILAGCKNGIPVFLNSSPQMGATSPITVAGCAALLNAEVLGMMTISQVFYPGSVVVYTSRPFAMDMKVTASTFGYMESTLANALVVQMAKQRYGLPIDIIGPCTDSKVVDVQSAMERTWTSFIPILVGADIAIGLGNIENVNTNSLQQLVLDNELFAGIKRLLKGVRVDEETLGFDAIDKVGPGGNYLSSKHTQKHFREVMRQSELFDRSFRATWEKEGQPQVLDRVNEKIDSVLQEGSSEKMAEGAIQQLDEIAREAEKALVSFET